MAYETIIVEREDHVETIKLNRPDALNALNDTLLSELGDALTAAQANALDLFDFGCEHIIVKHIHKVFVAHRGDICARCKRLFRSSQDDTADLFVRLCSGQRVTQFAQQRVV